MEGLRKDIKSANTALTTAREACTPFPSVDPPYQDYFVDPDEEMVMDPLVEEGSTSGEEEIIETKVD